MKEIIHIVNGDVVARKLVGIQGEIIVWKEMYDVGPLNSNWSCDEFIKHRASFFEKYFAIPADLFISNCQMQLRALDRINQDEEIILWFEHDRYDQTMLIYLLKQLSTRGLNRLLMVSTDKFPGYKPFYGFGQLSAKDLMKLFSKRVSITDEQIIEAKSAWLSYTSNEREELERWINEEKHVLPYLQQALKIHCTYFPSFETGLNEVEFRSLTLISEEVNSFHELFELISKERGCDGLSDLHFAAILKQLTRGDKPLLLLDGNLPAYNNYNPNGRITITPFGKDVLAGKANRNELIGIDWWVGGVHLHCKA